MKSSKNVLKTMVAVAKDSFGAGTIVSAFIALSICPTSNLNAQGVGINPSGNNPDPSAMIDVSSTAKGALIPRMTNAERNAITSPANSLLIYNTTDKCLQMYFNPQWQN